MTRRIADIRLDGVFINCPFDADYEPLLDAIVFAVIYCRLSVRTGLMRADAGQLRLQKILSQIEQSRFSIHDISRIEPGDDGLPRFNMPLELGLALGMKHLGRKALRDHIVIILDRDRYRYQAFASDLAGVDIMNHNNDPVRIIAAVRDSLAPHLDYELPTPGVINAARVAFLDALPQMAAAVRQEVGELAFIDRLRHIGAFISVANAA
ncbi:hypothetical protein [Sandarakinorhabdus sp.]|uniref:hypothetical protein n=1 Tax=Sandarakinorhabdus sp. TaxID=1916663 RepID=UPI00286DAC2B|nr:hypothetical protein [Sandarakinorhabdus sp.]